MAFARLLCSCSGHLPFGLLDPELRPGGGGFFTTVVTSNCVALSPQLPTPPITDIRDFALHQAGARPIPSLTSPTYLLPPRTTLSRILEALRGIDTQNSLINPPHTALDLDNTIGSCWAFSGSVGHLGISLEESVSISHVVIENIPAHLVSKRDFERSPKDMTLWGLLDSHTLGDLDEEDLDRFLRLAEFTFNASASRAQRFPITPQYAWLTFSTVVLRIDSNAGASSTCLYRVGIHGVEVE
ncbi:hypothetical protein PLICRDRAFT_104790 [Plicaturopsis crispa FD-325 SS-3]|nr:hypothetical protein PLICRDRAFT_104790 [Plicaturopsis crispa FD-325 SS-3]